MSLVRCLRQPLQTTVLWGNVSLCSSSREYVPFAFSKGKDVFLRHISLLPVIHQRQCQQQQQRQLTNLCAKCTNVELASSLRLICRPHWIEPVGGRSLAVQHRFYGTDANKSQAPKTEAAKAGSDGSPEGTGEVENPSIFQRFKAAYKQHGKVLIGVHIATSIVWFGSFYMAATSGLDIIPWLEKMGASETIIRPFRAGGLGNIAVAYLLYKLFTPARYTVTLGGTNFAIKYLRRKGKMEPVKQGESLREFYREGRKEVMNSKLRAQRLARIKRTRAKREAEKRK